MWKNQILMGKQSVMFAVHNNFVCFAGDKWVEVLEVASSEEKSPRNAMMVALRVEQARKKETKIIPISSRTFCVCRVNEITSY